MCFVQKCGASCLAVCRRTSENMGKPGSLSSRSGLVQKQLHQIRGTSAMCCMRMDYTVEKCLSCCCTVHTLALAIKTDSDEWPGVKLEMTLSASGLRKRLPGLGRLLNSQKVRRTNRAVSGDSSFATSPNGSVD
ncbi:hypothetical protein KCU81_g341, partial [Aureobasidium melanogenum]